MTVILIFIAFVVVGDVAAVTISYMVEQVSKSASLVVFFSLYAVVFYVAWQLALWVNERYIARPN